MHLLGLLTKIVLDDVQVSSSVSVKGVVLSNLLIDVIQNGQTPMVVVQVEREKDVIGLCYVDSGSLGPSGNPRVALFLQVLKNCVTMHPMTGNFPSAFLDRSVIMAK